MTTRHCLLRTRPLALCWQGNNRWILLVAWLACHQWLVLDGTTCSRQQTQGSGGWSNIFACAMMSHVKDQSHVLAISPITSRRNLLGIRGGAGMEGIAAAAAAATSSSTTASQAASTSINQLILDAGKRGLGGGLSGALAGMVQVFTLMWLRTIMTYQCRYGTNFTQALQTLLRDGGIARLYRGLPFALIQAPLCRFVSTAANDGVNLLLGRLEATKDWGPGRKVAIASLVVGFWRMVLMRKCIASYYWYLMVSTRIR